MAIPYISDVDWMGLSVPFAYLFVLVASLMTFSRIYRKRKAMRSAKLEPLFGPHLARNVYLSLLHLDGEGDEKKTDAVAKKDGKSEGESGVPETLLRAALLRRLVEDFHRLIQINSASQALTTLVAKGSVSDELVQRYERAKAEINEELRDVAMEANALCPGWGQFIFQTANEMVVNSLLREQIGEIEGKLAGEKVWWEKRRALLQSEALEELTSAA